MNSNIRCIEMNIARAKAIEKSKLNSNIRCIEIKYLDDKCKTFQLNSNIRCIEMINTLDLFVNLLS